MSYLVNTALTYTALGATTGMPSDTFSYSWVFSDGGSGATNTLAHTWTTAGSHLATVTATDNQTLGQASASKSVNVVDPLTLNWVSTGINMFPLGSAAAGQQAPWAEKLVSIGNFLINPVDYYAQQSIVSYDTVNNIRYQTDTALTIDVGVAITEGVNAGKMLFTVQGSTACKLYDPTTRAVTSALSAKPTAPYTNPTYRQSVVVGASGNYYFHGRTSANTQSLEVYNSITDTWATLTASSVPITEQNIELFYTGGKILAINHASTTTYIYDVVGNTWSAGPTSPLGVVATGNPQFVLTDGGYVVGMNGLAATAKMYSWKVGDAAFTAGASLFPLASVSVGANGVREHTPVALPGGIVVFINGNETTGSTDVSDLKTVFYTGITTDAFVVGTSFLTTLPGAEIMVGYAGGKIWRCVGIAGNKILEYMVW